MANLTPQEVLAAVDTWTLVQINEFVEAFCEKYNVSASAPVAVAAGPAAGAGAEAAEEKTEFTVMLTDAGAEKIKVIKEIRVINPSLGLKEAKEVADKVPSELVKDVSKADAEKVKQQIEAVGGKVEIK
ncbi:50S ribosomal protein L7/L12 [Candidatus Sumerlaeota bacterium]|nr:50S ribosomal protein L7/L12 [Candidatus Sumerlaeota bacterium]